MAKLKTGTILKTHCYKHDGQIHKSWAEAILLEETEEHYIIGNCKTIVTEADGRTWRTKEPAIVFFSKTNWYHIIGQLKDTGVYYYCDIASPAVIEENTIKYIDYDLDLRVFPDGSFKILDRGEYQYHKKIMNYSKELDKILKSELSSLIDQVRKHSFPFDNKYINKYYTLYNNIIKKQVNKQQA